jgi:hypothetical protein
MSDLSNKACISGTTIMVAGTIIVEAEAGVVAVVVGGTTMAMT